MRYMLDTNICIHLLHGKYHIAEKMSNIRRDQCVISEITKAELRYGEERAKLKNAPIKKEGLDEFLAAIEVMPISPAIDLYAKEKARLDTAGTGIEDLDLFIGCSAVVAGCILVTENVRHFDRISGLKIENWVERNS